MARLRELVAEEYRVVIVPPAWMGIATDDIEPVFVGENVVPGLGRVAIYSAIGGVNARQKQAQECP